MPHMCLIHQLDQWQQAQEKLRAENATKIWELRVKGITAIQAWRYEDDVVRLYMHPVFANRLSVIGTQQRFNEFSHSLNEMDKLASMFLEIADSVPEYTTA